MTAIELKNINKDYGTGISKVQVLSDVSFKAHSGELSLVLGALWIRQEYFFDDCWWLAAANQRAGVD